MLPIENSYAEWFVGVSNSLTVKTTITDILLVTLGSIKYVEHLMLATSLIHNNITTPLTSFA